LRNGFNDTITNTTKRNLTIGVVLFDYVFLAIDGTVKTKIIVLAFFGIVGAPVVSELRF